MQFNSLELIYDQFTFVTKKKKKRKSFLVFLLKNIAIFLYKTRIMLRSFESDGRNAGTFIGEGEGSSYDTKLETESCFL